MQIKHQEPCLETWKEKHALYDHNKVMVDTDMQGAFMRVARALAANEKNPKKWTPIFFDAMCKGVVPGGRILSNAGASEYKKAVSLINCTVSGTIEDSIESIMQMQTESVLTLKAGCGIGYEFSTLRPKGAFVNGPGASTSGPLSFMHGYDRYCDTISSAGGRRGAQMATFDIGHPDVVEFIKAKRTDGVLRKFNLSLLITDEFLDCVREEGEWKFRFNGVETGQSMPAVELWNLIMRSTYEYAEPGFLLIDVINRMNNLWFCENIRATNPCGEQPLPPYGACLLGSINLSLCVVNPFTDDAYFDWNLFKSLVRVANRMLDNVVEISGLQLEKQQYELTQKRRHGLGFMGLGSAMAMLMIRYGSAESVAFTELVTQTLALTSYDEGANLAKEKGMAPILKGKTDGKSNVELFLQSKYLQQFEKFDEGKAMLAKIKKHGCRYTHAISIAPTGTIAFGVGNNCSGGIEPSFSHSYFRNKLVEGKSTKEQLEVFSYEALVYKHINGLATLDGVKLPEYFATANSVTPKEHIDVQAAAQQWVDSSISKTINVPADIKFEDFQDLYMYGVQKGLKGCTTYRPNPKHIGAVLVTKEEQAKHTYNFKLEDGTVVSARGDEKIKYNGEEHVASLLFEAIREGTYGRYN